MRPVPATGTGVSILDPEAMCEIHHRDAQAVYFGTYEPTEVALSPGQILAIGRLDVDGGVCSATVIGPRWALTAAHCTRVETDLLELQLGRDPSSPDVRIAIRNAYDSPLYDFTLLELDRDARDELPDLVPIRISTEAIDDSMVGRMVEAAGYGQDERGRLGTRKFSAEPIDEVSDRMITIDGQGLRGVCFGDSGGPLLTRVGDGSVRVIGALSGGESSCVGRDNFSRVDRVRSFIEGYTGPTPETEELGCRGFSAEGRCVLGVAVYCEDDVLVTDVCADDSQCGWSEEAASFRCVAPEVDPCGGIDNWGVCDGDQAVFCRDGEIQRVDCGECGLGCGVSLEAGGVTCAADPCATLDFLGACQGDTAVWCNGGVYYERDCALEGMACGWVGEDDGFFCQPTL